MAGGQKGLGTGVRKGGYKNNQAEGDPPIQRINVYVSTVMEIV